MTFAYCFTCYCLIGSIVKLVKCPSTVFDSEFAHFQNSMTACLRLYEMSGRSQIQGVKNWIFPKEMNANRFFRDSHWLEIWKNN
jgi:hypothetical protein